MKPKNVEVNCLCCGNKVITSLDVVEKTPLCIKCIDIFETKNANLHRESDRLNDELENLKEALVDACTNKLFRCSTCDVKGCRAGRDNKYECIKTQMDYYKERAREK